MSGKNGNGNLDNGKWQPEKWGAENWNGRVRTCSCTVQQTAHVNPQFSAVTDCSSSCCTAQLDDVNHAAV